MRVAARLSHSPDWLRMMHVADSVATWRLEDLFEGETVAIEKTIGEADIDAFAALSGDVSPLHMDAEFARARGFRGRVAHGALISSYVSRLLGVSLPGRDCLLHSLNMRYLLPVHAGDTILVRLTVRQISAAVRTVVLDVDVTGKDAMDVVAKGKAQVGLTQEGGQ